MNVNNGVCEVPKVERIYMLGPLKTRPWIDHLNLLAKVR